MKVLSGKTAIVTGGSRGIGRAIVNRLARDGARVMFTYARNGQGAEEVAAEVRSVGGWGKAVQADFTEPGAVEALLEAAEQDLDGLDILVHSASPSFERAMIADTADGVWDGMMYANARVAFQLVRHAALTMRNGGSIITISTLNTTRPVSGNAAYAASKGAIEQLTKVAAMELGARQITVNAVCPGATDTDLLRHTNPEEALARVAALTPLGRLGAPEDIANVVAMLAGPDGRWITGQVLKVSGGLA